MKNLFLVSFLTLAPLAASASELICRQPGQGEHVLRAIVAEDQKSAELQSATFFGAKKVADLDCDRLTKTPQGPHVFLACYERGAGEGGYLLELRTGGFTGLITADLSRNYLSGPRPLTSMNCAAE